MSVKGDVPSRRLSSGCLKSTLAGTPIMASSGNSCMPSQKRPVGELQPCTDFTNHNLEQTLLVCGHIYQML